MAKHRFDDIELLVIDPTPGSRDSVRSILHNQGFRKMQLGGSLEEMRAYLLENTPDLLISEIELGDGNACSVIAAVRHRKIGTNPFLPVIALTWEPTPDLVRGAVNAGVDDLITKPISTVQIVNRINALITARKPFVVTSDYIGPDRRGKEAERGTPIPRVEVPNVLRAKATGEKIADNLQTAIDATFAEINIQRLDRYAVQIGFLIDHALPGLQKGTPDATTVSFLNRLLEVAEDTGRLLGGTKYAHVSDLCGSLIKVTRAIIAAKNNPNPRDVKLLRPLAQAIQQGFDSTAGTADAARRISSQIVAS